MAKKDYKKISVASSAFFQRGFLSSIFLVIIGLALFLVGTRTLFDKEADGVMNNSDLIEGLINVIELDSRNENFDSIKDDVMIHVSGKAITKKTIKDPTFNIAVNALALKRVVQMFQWVETKDEKSGQYQYTKKWKTKIIDAKKFQKIKGHTNPANMPFESNILRAKFVTVAGFYLSKGMIKEIKGFKPYNSKKQFSIPKLAHLSLTRKDNYLYFNKSQESSTIGDIRVQFMTIPHHEISIIAKKEYDNLVPFTTSLGRKISMVTENLVSSNEMILQKFTYVTLISFAFRLGAIFFMFLGLRLTLSSLSSLGDAVPIIDYFSLMGAKVVSIMFTAPLSLMVMAFFWYPYKPVIGYGMVALGLLISLYLFIMHKPEPREKEKVVSNKKQRSDYALGNSKKDTAANAIDLNYETGDFGKAKSAGLSRNESSLISKERLEKEYYIYSKEKKYGPYSISKIEKFIQSGKVKPHTLCKAIDSKKQIRVKEIPGIILLRER